MDNNSNSITISGSGSSSSPISINSFNIALINQYLKKYDSLDDTTQHDFDLKLKKLLKILNDFEAKQCIHDKHVEELKLKHKQELNEVRNKHN